MSAESHDVLSILYGFRHDLDELKATVRDLRGGGDEREEPHLVTRLLARQQADFDAHLAACRASAEQREVQWDHERNMLLVGLARTSLLTPFQREIDRLTAQVRNAAAVPLSPQAIFDRLAVVDDAPPTIDDAKKAIGEWKGGCSR